VKGRITVRQWAEEAEGYEEAVMSCWKLLACFVSAFVGNPGVVTEATVPEQQATHAFPEK
jgi:hypothetical protein